VQSEYFEEIENLAGTQDEIALLTQEMRRSLVLQIIRRASAAIQ
jgi:outer membrane lipopolysaccharide assembly protein LptE/RlpB